MPRKMRMHTHPKYKKGTKYEGQRAWFQKFALSSGQNIDWRGTRPKVFEGLDASAFGPSGRAVETPKSEEVYQRVTVAINDTKIVWLYYSSTDCYFVCEYECIRKKFTSVLYTSREKAKLELALGTIKWRRSDPIT
jgi:hypothetical protein